MTESNIVPFPLRNKLEGTAFLRVAIPVVSFELTWMYRAIHQFEDLDPKAYHPDLYEHKRLGLICRIGADAERMLQAARSLEKAARQFSEKQRGEP